MSLLMPQGSFRWCRFGHRWFTASPAECVCPKCHDAVVDATAGWPHVCSSGHGAQHGGDCAECRVEAVAKVEKQRARASQ